MVSTVHNMNYVGTVNEKYPPQRYKVDYALEEELGGDKRSCFRATVLVRELNGQGLTAATGDYAYNKGDARQSAAARLLEQADPWFGAAPPSQAGDNKLNNVAVGTKVLELMLVLRAAKAGLSAGAADRLRQTVLSEESLGGASPAARFKAEIGARAVDIADALLGDLAVCVGEEMKSRIETAVNHSQ